SSTPRFEEVDSTASPPPEGISLKRAAYFSRLFVSVNTFLRGGDFELSLRCASCEAPASGEGKYVLLLRLCEGGVEAFSYFCLGGLF
ncbi:hypothetical protein ACIPR8_16495, partial [Stenotrophomonas sp. LARHCG68]